MSADDGMPRRPARTSQAEPVRVQRPTSAHQPRPEPAHVGYFTRPLFSGDSRTIAIVHSPPKSPVLRLDVMRDGMPISRPLLIFAREIGPLLTAIDVAREPECEIGNREVARLTLRSGWTTVYRVARTPGRPVGVGIRVHAPDGTPNGKHHPTFFDGEELLALEKAARDLVRLARQ